MRHPGFRGVPSDAPQRGKSRDRGVWLRRGRVLVLLRAGNVRRERVLVLSRAGNVRRGRVLVLSRAFKPRPEGAKAPSPGQASVAMRHPGFRGVPSYTPQRGKSSDGRA